MKKTLNEETLKFILEYENQIKCGEVLNKKEIEEEFRRSLYCDEMFDSYNSDSLGKSIWWGLKRSGCWGKVGKGLYQRMIKTKNGRAEYIEHLSENLYEILLMKNGIKDRTLKKYHLSSKGIGEDLYYLTVGYFKEKGEYKNKYYMSDFITAKAKEILESKQKEKLVYEHMVPKSIYIKEISNLVLNGELNKNSIYEFLNKYYYVCTVTEEEDEKLPTLKMGEGWDGENPFYRYEKLGIGFMENY